MKVSNKVLEAVLAMLNGIATDEQKALVLAWANEGKAKRDAMKEVK